MRNILVVDDDERVIDVVAGMLTPRGFRIIGAHTAGDAIDAAARAPVHLIICDVHMPGLQGPELLAHLRRGGVDAPVLFISGYLELDTVDRALTCPTPPSFRSRLLRRSCLRPLRQTCADPMGVGGPALTILSFLKPRLS